MIFATQPVAALFECADEIKSHHHFHVFGALMTQIGFKLAWEQIMPYHTSHITTGIDGLPCG